MQQNQNESKIPVGIEFLKLIREQEERCESVFEEWLPTAGIKAPQIPAALGTALSYLDRLASCYWICRESDHIEERLIGRAYSNAKASLRLSTLGFYDESLAVTRQIGETANLLLLFVVRKELREEWKSTTESMRRKRFSAGKVRKEIERLSDFIPMDSKTYERLSVMSVHAVPDTSPQSYNPHGLPSAANYFQKAGALTSLNHLADMVGWTLWFGALLTQPPIDRSIIKKISLELLMSVGKASVTSLPELWDEIKASDEFVEVERELVKWQNSRQRISKD